MKRLILFLLAAVMVFSLAACGEGNDSDKEPSAPPEGWAAEYTIFIGGSDNWTPYAGKSGVTFVNSDKTIIDISDNGTKVEFVGKAVGEAVITATLDGIEKKSLVRVKIMETNAPNIAYNPPNDYYIKLMNEDGEEREYCKIGNNYTEVINSDELLAEHYSGETGEVYALYENQGWVWNEGGDDVDAGLETAKSPLPYFFDMLYKLRMSRDGEESKQFYIRTEKYLNRDCGVYELSDNGVLIGGKCRVWVDLETGCLLKAESLGGSGSFEVSVFQFDNLSWSASLRPTPYGSEIRP